MRTCVGGAGGFGTDWPTGDAARRPYRFIFRPLRCKIMDQRGVETSLCERLIEPSKPHLSKNCGTSYSSTGF